jgi:hypothetical protein
MSAVNCRAASSSPPTLSAKAAAFSSTPSAAPMLRILARIPSPSNRSGTNTIGTRAFSSTSIVSGGPLPSRARIASGSTDSTPSGDRRRI